MNEKLFSVYMHKNKINGKVYIGATSQKPETRWNKGLGYKHSKEMYSDILKYGWDNFEHIVIINNLDQEQSQALEQFYIKKYKDNSYNKQIGGEKRTLKSLKPKSSQKQLNYSKSYYERNKEKIIQNIVKREKENREKYNQKSKDYYKNNEYRQRKIEYQRKYRYEHRKSEKPYRGLLEIE